MRTSMMRRTQTTRIGFAVQRGCFTFWILQCKGCREAAGLSSNESNFGHHNIRIRGIYRVLLYKLTKYGFHNCRFMMNLKTCIWPWTSKSIFTSTQIVWAKHKHTSLEHPFPWPVFHLWSSWASIRTRTGRGSSSPAASLTYFGLWWLNVNSALSLDKEVDFQWCWKFR